MKLSASELRRVIRNETKSIIREVARPRRRLSSLIFEDIADDLNTAYKKGPGAVRSYVDGAKDKEAVKDTLKGLFDNDPNDDKITVGSSTSVKVGGLKATQSEIDLMKSVAFPLGGFDALKDMITSNTTGAPGAITVSGDLVLDGHHRWSGVVGICGNDGNILVQDLGLPGSDTEKLAASQLAIAAYKPAATPIPSASDTIENNVLGAGASAIKKMILANVGKQTDAKAPGPMLNAEMVEKSSKDDVVAKWAGFKVGASPEEVKNAIATKVGENLAGLQVGDAPPRADMPQFDDKSIGGKAAKADIYKGMAAGDFNIEPPFKSGEESNDGDEKKSKQNAGYYRSGQVVMERWQRLAGIIK
jgi:hypothetical protein